MSDELTIPAEPEVESSGTGRLAWITASAGFASVATAAAISLFVEAIRPQAEWLSRETSIASFARLFFTIGGMLAVGAAVSLRPDRLAMLALACVAAVLARYGFHPAWDSGRMVAGFAAIAAGISAVLMALPQTWRRAGVSLLVLFHFGGILTMVSVMPNQEQPWLQNVAYTYVYRPYLRFIDMTAGHHYFGGDPGPSDLVWFCVNYDDGTARWYKLPRRSEDLADPSELSVIRRGALANETQGYEVIKEIPSEVNRRRDMMSYGQNGIPWHPRFPHEQQYRPPSALVRNFLLPSYVEHVVQMKSMQHPEGRSVKSVKVYRVEHQILTAAELKIIEDPYAPNTYLPYFYGEYDAEGRQINTDDPMLYWIVPIIYVPKSPEVDPWHTPRSHPEEFELVDGLRRHSGSDHER
jgi:hypothetical protein